MRVKSRIFVYAIFCLFICNIAITFGYGYTAPVRDDLNIYRSSTAHVNLFPNSTADINVSASNRTYHPHTSLSYDAFPDTFAEQTIENVAFTSGESITANNHTEITDTAHEMIHWTRSSNISTHHDVLTLHTHHYTNTEHAGKIQLNDINMNDSITTYLYFHNHSSFGQPIEIHGNMYSQFGQVSFTTTAENTRIFSFLSTEGTDTLILYNHHTEQFLFELPFEQWLQFRIYSRPNGSNLHVYTETIDSAGHITLTPLRGSSTHDVGTYLSDTSLTTAYFLFAGEGHTSGKVVSVDRFYPSSSAPMSLPTTLTLNRPYYIPENTSKFHFSLDLSSLRPKNYYRCPKTDISTQVTTFSLGLRNPLMDDQLRYYQFQLQQTTNGLEFTLLTENNTISLGSSLKVTATYTTEGNGQIFFNQNEYTDIGVSLPITLLDEGFISDENAYHVLFGDLNSLSTIQGFMQQMNGHAPPIPSYQLHYLPSLAIRSQTIYITLANAHPNSHLYDHFTEETHFLTEGHNEITLGVRGDFQRVRNYTIVIYQLDYGLSISEDITIVFNASNVREESFFIVYIYRPVVWIGLIVIVLGLFIYSYLPLFRCSEVETSNSFLPQFNQMPFKTHRYYAKQRTLEKKEIIWDFTPKSMFSDSTKRDDPPDQDM